MLRDLHGTKHYIQEAEKMVRRLNNADRLEWEQQREKDNLASLVISQLIIYRLIRSTGYWRMQKMCNSPIPAPTRSITLCLRQVLEIFKTTFMPTPLIRIMPGLTSLEGRLEIRSRAKPILSPMTRSSIQGRQLLSRYRMSTSPVIALDVLRGQGSPTVPFMTSEVKLKMKVIWTLFFFNY